MSDRSVTPHNGSDLSAGSADDSVGVPAEGLAALPGEAEDAEFPGGGGGESSSSLPSAGGNGRDSGALARILAGLEDLTAAVGRDHDRAVHREQIIDRLHEENQRLRHGEVRSAFEPVQTRLYRLYDLVVREASRSEWDPVHVPAVLTAIADEVVEVIERTGVEKLDVRVGEPYDSARHRPVGVAETGDPSREGTVAAVQRGGFAHGDRVVRRAEVVVARATPPGAPRGQEPNGAPRGAAPPENHRGEASPEGAGGLGADSGTGSVTAEEGPPHTSQAEG